MIKTLYPIFQKWSEKGSVWIISDTHFEDDDCLFMDPNWLTPEEHIKKLSLYIGKNDTVIHLGDVGNPEWMKKIKGYKVLIMGNHDQSSEKFKDYFNEIYSGPLMIAEKIILSHEPVTLCAGITGQPIAFNIHGHDHSGEYYNDDYHINCASNIVNYYPTNLYSIIKSGLISNKNIKSLHRQIIDKAGSKHIDNEIQESLDALKEILEQS